jgi:hypothetical protein
MRPTPAARKRANNRILAVMLHLSRYGCRSQIRLAEDTGFSPSAISRLLAQRSSPSFALVVAVTHALEQQLGRRIRYGELVSFGAFPTPSVCTLCGCSGCLPPFVYDENDNVRPEYRHIRPGQWALEFDPPGTVRVVAMPSVKEPKRPRILQQDSS